MFIPEALRGYILLNVDPELDSAYPAAALSALQQADWVIALTSFHNDAVKQYADVILPQGGYNEVATSLVSAKLKECSFAVK